MFRVCSELGVVLRCFTVFRVQGSGLIGFRVYRVLGCATSGFSFRISGLGFRV